MKTYLEIVVTKTDKVDKRFDATGIPKSELNEIYNKKGKTLAKSKFMRIINADEELESTPLKPKPKAQGKAKK
jgi:hypothetical protein